MLRSSVPSVVALGSVEADDQIDGVLSRKCLGMVSPGGAYDVQFYYRFSVLDPLAKFALEPSKSEQGLVNVRCCYNNRYWSRPHPNVTTIIAEVDEPVEDTTSYKCTLFKPNLVDCDGKVGVQFLHVQTGRNLVLYWSDNSYYRFLMISQSDSESADNPLTSILLDYESLVFLPKRVMFQGNNKKYLQPSDSSNNYLQFGQVDPGSENVIHEVFTTSDGQIQVKNAQLGKYWKCSTDDDSNWIRVDADNLNGDSNNDLNTFFEVLKGNGQGVIALRNMGNKHLCKRNTYGDKEDCLDASAMSIVSDAQLVVYEPVVSRLVREVHYRLDAARIFGVTPLTLAESNAENRGNIDSQVQLEFSRTITKSKTWSHHVGASVSITAECTSGIPFIADAKVNVSAEANYEFNWGTTEETTDSIKTTHTVTVPPRSKVKVTLLATKGTCEVPFSYTQVDRLNDGQVITTTLEDGVFTCVDYYSFYHTSSEPEPLP